MNVKQQQETVNEKKALLDTGMEVCQNTITANGIRAVHVAVLGGLVTQVLIRFAEGQAVVVTALAVQLIHGRRTILVDPTEKPQIQRFYRGCTYRSKRLKQGSRKDTATSAMRLL